MTSNREQKVPWERIGRPLSDLLRYERRNGRYEHASYELLSALIHDSNAPSWRRFLLDGDNFGVVADQVIALASRDGTDAAAALDSTRELVEAAYRRDPAEAAGLLDAYLRGRADLPVDVRNRADGLVKDGEQATALAVSALASEIRCLRAEGRLDGPADATFDYWYEEVLRGRVGADGEPRPHHVDLVAGLDDRDAHAAGLGGSCGHRAHDREPDSLGEALGAPEPLHRHLDGDGLRLVRPHGQAMDVPLRVAVHGAGHRGGRDPEDDELRQETTGVAPGGPHVKLIDRGSPRVELAASRPTSLEAS